MQEKVESSFWTLLTEKVWRRKLVSAFIVTIIPYIIAVNTIVNLSPKKIPGILMYANITAFVGSLLSVLMVKKVPLNNLIPLSLNLLVGELLGMYLTFSTSQDWLKATLILMFILTFSASLGTATNFYVIHAFAPTNRGAGIGFVGVVSSAVVLVSSLVIDRYVHLQLTDDFTLGLYTVSTFFVFVAALFVEEVRAEESGDDDTK